MKNYELLDSGNLKKLEKFGGRIIARPCMQAIWKPKLDEKVWGNADLIFERDSKNKWIHKKKTSLKNPKKEDSWIVDIEGIKLNLKLTDFGHIGFFPEHIFLCKKLSKLLQDQNPQARKLNVLNLFAYSGLASLFALKNKASVCHVDSSKPSILWAKENIKLNNFQNLNIRYILDDAIKFLKREVKRGSKYDAIVLDPPSFGRGAKGEVFKIEKDIVSLLELSKKLLSKKKSFIIFSCHSPNFTKITIKNLFESIFDNNGNLEVDELLLKSEKSYNLPSGYFSIWQKNENKYSDNLK
ncbi:MAG: Ribosomal RNA large subunit methyltransferase K [Candidatus Anoxychlamydiales bacterium]|nr:Ribosomal RNA large subunit methyltransferase K [Candidatus Anoxychlamydiales bacterium]